MLTGMISGVTRVLGKSQGYLGLPVRDGLDGGNAVMVSAWTPTPDEIARIVAGASIYLTVLGSNHPPVKLDVGDAPE